MSNGDLVLALAPEYQQIISGRNTTAAGVIHDCFMRQVLCHCAITNRQRLFPDRIPGYEVKPAMTAFPVLLFKRRRFAVASPAPDMEPDDIALKISQMVGAAIAGWDIHTVNCCHTPRQRDPLYLLNHMLVMGKELGVVERIRQVSFIRTVAVQSAKWRRIDRYVAALPWKRGHYLDRVTAIQR